MSFHYESFLVYIILIVVWVSNVNDLIRGHWFYHNTYSILFWNFWGVLALIYIIRSKGKK